MSGPDTTGPDTTATPQAGGTTSSRLLGASAVMAAGTVFSRLSGFVRAVLLAAALGQSLHAELFTIANTIPNMLYILLAGGVFNAVLVPQLVRAMTHDEDGGQAYTDRIMTAAGLFLLGVTVALVLAAPLLLDLYLDSGYRAPELAAQRESIVDLTRYCLPQVFFYGMFVLIGQVLNARGRFGPMMWAPIANNVISVAVLVGYLLTYGAASGAELQGAYSTDQEALLGIGSTLGIAVQCAILVPYMRSAGFRFRPRFDLRGTGLGHTLRLGLWTVGFVIVNQIAYLVLVRLASSGVLGGDDGTGYTVYANAFLVVMVPHAVVTVSLATAALPELSAAAAAERFDRLATTLASVLRTALVVVLPVAAMLPLVATPIARLLLHGAAGREPSIEAFARTLAVFGPGVVLFTVHYLMLRGFYALEDTRTVFVNQCWVAMANVAAAIVLVRLTDDQHTAPALVGAYSIAYLVGSVLSFTVLRRRLGTLQGHVVLRFLVRWGIAVALATATAWLALTGLRALHSSSAWPWAIVEGAWVGSVELAVLALTARAMHIREVTTLARTVTRRLGSRSAR